MIVRDWTVDYGHGPSPCAVPHAWRQDVTVTWEGPAVYVARLELKSSHWLLFHGVSYEAKVYLDGTLIATHEGIWDAFSVPVEGQGSHELRVEVTKNGGPRFPVREVASGFLPFVYHTFGGIFKPVELLDKEPVLDREAAPPRYAIDGKRIRMTQETKAQSASFRSQADEWLAKRAGTKTEPIAGPQEKDLYVRGVLSWGWYPELGHMNPPDDVIRREVDQVKSLGFNLIKFCLWVPSHRFLEIMEESGMHAWLELPLWDPVDDSDAQEKIFEEFERIVRQYRHHPNIALWTCGCELHATTSAAYRKRLYDMVKEHTGGLVKDNSGSAEMYGGDLREYGDFYDFHPYCDTPFYPEVLDSLQVGPRRKMPILLGEFNDSDVHRDLPRVQIEAPYWASADPTLNDQGVRWQYDLPGFMPTNRFANAPEEHRHAALMSGSRSKSLFMRKYVQEAVRARDDIAGYVVTGWRDTPISTSGFIDDWDQLRFKPEELSHWNREGCLFLIPTRRPAWTHGGNRPGWIDPFNWFEGRAFWKIGLHSDQEVESQLEWDILHFSWQGNRRPKGRVAQGSGRPMTIKPMESTEVGEVSWDTDEPGGYLLRVQFGDISNTWPFWVLPKGESPPVRVWDPGGLLEVTPGEKSDLMLAAGVPVCIDRGLMMLTDDGTVPSPFWRESAYEFQNASFWERLGYREAWERFLPISADRTIDLDWVRLRWPDYEWETLLNRIDVRTYAEAPILLAGRRQKNRLFITTLKPFGGPRNPSGTHFIQTLLSLCLEDN